MHRTTIMLPENLKAAAEHKAHRMGRSLGQLIREALERELRPSKSHRAEDVLLADSRIFRGDAPTDLSTHHDDYLYGDKA